MICKSCGEEMYAEFEWIGEMVLGGPTPSRETGKRWCTNKDCKRCGLVFAEVD